MSEITIGPLGETRWTLNGKLHRETGPAVEYASGTRMWIRRGRRHRDDGPAIEWANGDCDWWLHGESYTFDSWLDQVDCTPEQRTLLLLKWS